MNPDLERIVIRLEPSSLDQIPMGLLRTLPDGTISYLNEAARTMGRHQVQVGDSLRNLHFAPQSRDRLDSEMARRQATREGSAYTIVLEPSANGVQVRMQVSAVPEYGPGGEMIGAVAFVNDTTVEDVNLAIHEAIGSALGWRSLLTAVAAHLHQAIDFDAVLISLVGQQRRSMRVFFEDPEPVDPALVAWRWWPMPRMVSADLDELEFTRADAVAEMFASPPYKALADTDEITRLWLAQGYQHMLRRPIMQAGRLVAIVSLLRRHELPFAAQDIERLDDLPVPEAVSMALALEREQELRFCLGVIARMGSVAASIADVARVLVDELRAHFRWPHVSLFRVDRDRGKVSLVYQAATGPEARLREGHEQDIGTGLLGRVADTREAIHSPDVDAEPAYIQGIDGTRSEMCLPVPGDALRWILNVESSAQGAFAEEEMLAVTPLLGVAGLILDRTTALEFKHTVLESIADAVVQTSSQGEITEINEAGWKLLGLSRAELVGTSLAPWLDSAGKDLESPEFAAQLLAMKKVLPAEIRLLVRNGPPIPVLISGNSLPPEVGGKVYVISNLNFRLQVQRMEALKQIFGQVASETRTPLALCASFMGEALEASRGTPAFDLIEKSLRHLRRADLPLERVVRLAAAPDELQLPLDQLDLRELVNALMVDLPSHYLTQIRFEADAPAVLAWGARPEFTFCVNSLLAGLIRMKAQRDELLLRVQGDLAWGQVSLELVQPATLQPGEPVPAPRSKRERDFFLAEDAIKDLMTRMQGVFKVQEEGALRFTLQLKPWGPA